MKNKCGPIRKRKTKSKKGGNVFSKGLGDLVETGINFGTQIKNAGNNLSIKKKELDSAIDYARKQEERNKYTTIGSITGGKRRTKHKKTKRKKGKKRKTRRKHRKKRRR
jgi:hypothetical protein